MKMSRLVNFIPPWEGIDDHSKKACESGCRNDGVACMHVFLRAGETFGDHLSRRCGLGERGGDDCNDAQPKASRLFRPVLLWNVFRTASALACNYIFFPVRHAGVPLQVGRKNTETGSDSKKKIVYLLVICDL